jgi:hypothetical protein
VSDLRLPIELTELERELAAMREGVSPLFEARLLARVRMALQAQRRASDGVFALAAAAVLLVGLHISWQASQGVPPRSADNIDRAQLAAGTRTILALLPELSTADAERHALLMFVNLKIRPAAGGLRTNLPPTFANRTLLD